MSPRLATTYLGLRLRNPLLASSSPLTGRLDTLRRLDDAGVGAVVLPSLFEEQIEREELMLDAMQTSDEYRVATPEGWQPGDRVIVPPAATVEEANKRMESGENECVDFYYYTKQLRIP